MINKEEDCHVRLLRYSLIIVTFFIQVRFVSKK